MALFSNIWTGPTCLMRLRPLVKAIPRCDVCIVRRRRAHYGGSTYRLDMVDKVGINLYDTWRETVDAYPLRKIGSKPSV